MNLFIIVIFVNYDFVKIVEKRLIRIYQEIIN